MADVRYLEVSDILKCQIFGGVDIWRRLFLESARYWELSVVGRSLILKDKFHCDALPYKYLLFIFDCSHSIGIHKIKKLRRVTFGRLLKRK